MGDRNADFQRDRTEPELNLNIQDQSRTGPEFNLIIPNQNRTGTSFGMVEIERERTGTDLNLKLFTTNYRQIYYFTHRTIFYCHRNLLNQTKTLDKSIYFINF